MTEKTVISTRNAAVFGTKNSFSATRFAAPTSPFSLQFSSSFPRRWNFSRSLKCSVDYNNDQGNGLQATYPRPPKVPWSKELCNTVHFIGLVASPVEIKHLASGKVLAWTKLTVRKSSTDTVWINLTLWDELANIAYQHVKKGQQIYVRGQLVTDMVESDSGKQQTYYRVVVQQLNFVEKSNTSSIEELWQAFFANPAEWWDNRKNKQVKSFNASYPDFKHKDTGASLWIEGRNNPSWVKSQLAILDSRMGLLHYQDERMLVKSMTTDEVMPS